MPGASSGVGRAQIEEREPTLKQAVLHFVWHHFLECVDPQQAAE